MTNEKLVKDLRIIANSNYNKDIHGESGLCGLLSKPCNTFQGLGSNQHLLVYKLMLEWSVKHGSGHSIYPVPSFNKLFMCTYKFSSTTPKQKWDKRTKYGRSRRHMCNFIADAIETSAP